jgi:site-specific DNA-cytosine methylase
MATTMKKKLRVSRVWIFRLASVSCFCIIEIRIYFQAQPHISPHCLLGLSGGFPCQPFSNMSTQPGMNCEIGRGLLFQEIIGVLKISKPKAFLLENVPGLYGMTETFEYIVRAFEDSG